MIPRSPKPGADEIPDAARLVKLLDAVASNPCRLVFGILPGAKLKMHGVASSALPIAPHSNQGRRKISMRPRSMLPADCCGLLSGFKSIAMLQLWATVCCPCAGDEKQNTV